HNALTGIRTTQFFVRPKSMVDGLIGRHLVPVGQYMDGNIIDSGGELWDFLGLFLRGSKTLRGETIGIEAAKPLIMGLAGCDRYRTLPLHLFDDFDHLVDGLIATENRFVSDDDCIDISVALGEFDGPTDLTLVSFFILFRIPIDFAIRQLFVLIAQPDTDRDLEAKLGCDAGNEVRALRRLVCADSSGIGADQPQVGSDLLRRGAVPIIGM